MSIWLAGNEASSEAVGACGRVGGGGMEREGKEGERRDGRKGRRGGGKREEGREKYTPSQKM